MNNIPRIISVRAISTDRLAVLFENGCERIFNCSALFSRPSFHLLKQPAFFRKVRVDPGGYGISWNDDIDLSEYELWTNGEETQ